MRSTLYICVIVAALSGCKQADIEKVKLTELNGDQIDLTDYKGQTVFINFWATWCGPCIKEMPTIDKAQIALKDKGVVFLIASDEEPAEIKEFMENRPFNFHYVQLTNMEELKIPALPTTYIFDEAGKLKFSETGTRDWSEPNNLNLITK
ncbi:MAG: TlpA family protein disulfide reductase [Bacteroidetes bacterium]|nr:TlpA family protein disulfide reductase [Bacteroidota bacterium]